MDSEAPAPARTEPTPEPKSAPQPAAETKREPEPAAPASEDRKPEEKTAESAPSVDVGTLNGTGQSSGTDAATDAYVTPRDRKSVEQGRRHRRSGTRSGH